MVEAIFLALAPALELWKNEAALRYKKQFAKLEKEFKDESNKPDPDHNRLDNIRDSIDSLLRNFASELGKSNASNMQK